MFSRERMTKVMANISELNNLPDDISMNRLENWPIGRLCDLTRM